MAAPVGDFDAENQFIQRKTSVYTNSDGKQETAPVVDAGGDLEGAEEKDEGTQARDTFNKRLRVVVLIALAALILGWWISSTILTATRGQWVVQTFFAWFFLLIIAFRFIPNSVVTEPIAAVWVPCVQVPWYKLPRTARLSIGWLCLLGIVFGSAFGFPLTGNSNYGNRAISVLGLFVFQCSFYLCSTNRSAICWPIVIVGLFLQQTIALFVLKTGAGFSFFKYIADLADDFLSQADVGAEFFFDAATIAKGWFFVNVLSAVIFFIATIQMLYYLGVMQWMVKGFAWFFFKLMNAASPWVGQGESACLVKPYVDIMTPSELHLVMTSGFSTISGSVLTAYIALGVPPQNLITSSVMSIPASIAISKMRIPEVDEPVTRGRIVVDRGDAGKNQPVNALHAFSLGGLFGLSVAGQILTNVLTILSLVATINAVLTWVGRGFGIHQLTLQLVLGYIGYPIAFFLGVPTAEILRVSQLLATKLIENEFAAYLELSSIQASSNPLSQRAFTIASYSLCGFANLGSLGIQIGVLGALAPSQGKVIAKLATSAMICGFISTLQTAGIAGMLV
ncbi:Na+ dependent nucleoside transporter C-terminus-domain-containing protein [Suillus subalutaceus]|uniref:Na+ dependent nucleoside transporter C-terminus-domain-containing protein n=1 Tax=Suillus subalutaceus TaxID=48586 RepID=UPI001B881792|nr:Na+ dependent nucleoside transporter C-terminus-domain-containing protein [Suillus subalutaceus]KAG1870109.1 Na+ dependent nucleoside transporter C-terminus-domain-containing protein [Suillus subalutaceus]